MTIKKSSRRVLVEAAFLLLILPTLKGAEGENADRAKISELDLLTLDKAIAYALENNQAYKARLESIGVAGGGLTQAAKRINPQWEMDLATDRFFSNHGDREFSFSLAQTFETGGQRKYRILEARSHLEKTKNEVEDFQRALVAEVKSSFYTILAAQRRLQLAKEMVQFNDNFMSTQTARWKEGTIPELALNLAKVEMSRTLRNLVQAETAVRTAKVRLSQLMGLPNYTPFKVVGEFSPSLPEYDLETLVESAIRLRPDIKSLENELQEQEYDLLLKKAEARPNVKLGLELLQKRNVFESSDIRYVIIPSRQPDLPPPIIFSSLNSGRHDHGPGPVVPPEPGAVISRIANQHLLLRFKLSVPLPLFNRNQGNIESALAARRAARLKLSYLRDSVRNEITTAYETLRLAQKARDLYETGILPQLKENLHIVTESYGLGAQSILAVIQEQRTFLDVNTQYLETLSEFQSALIRLESALGGKISDVAKK